jgi:hypothetical protein
MASFNGPSSVGQREMLHLQPRKKPRKNSKCVENKPKQNSDVFEFSSHIGISAAVFLSHYYARRIEKCYLYQQYAALPLLSMMLCYHLRFLLT